MKPILVHVHIYYTNMWEELKSCLKNIEPYPYDLYVTMTENHVELQKNILEFNPTAKIEVVENRGFDVAPFVCLINKINLDDYSYVVKLHTKREISNDFRLNGFNLIGQKWRRNLLSFISTKENFNKSLQRLEKKHIGMIANYKLIVGNKDEDIFAQKKLSLFLEKHHFPQIKYSFVAGTMFIAKKEIFKPLQNLLSINDFEKEFEIRGQTAHVVERFFGYLVSYNHQKIYLDFNQKLSRFCAALKCFLYQNKITQRGKRIIKICKIPVYSRRVKI